MVRITVARERQARHAGPHVARKLRRTNGPVLLQSQFQLPRIDKTYDTAPVFVFRDPLP